MKITESVGNRRDIWQPSTKIIELIPPDRINKGSVTDKSKNQRKQKMITIGNVRGWSELSFLNKEMVVGVSNYKSNVYVKQGNQKNPG